MLLLLLVIVRRREVRWKEQQAYAEKTNRASVILASGISRRSFAPGDQTQFVLLQSMSFYPHPQCLSTPTLDVFLGVSQRNTSFPFTYRLYLFPPPPTEHDLHIFTIYFHVTVVSNTSPATFPFPSPSPFSSTVLAYCYDTLIHSLDQTQHQTLCHPNRNQQIHGTLNRTDLARARRENQSRVCWRRSRPNPSTKQS